jgi:hypothetical protein
MSDFNSSLPVRTEHNGDVVINIADGTTETQLLAVDASGRITTKMDDGNGNAVTSQTNGAQRALDVGIDVAGVQIDPRSIRALTSADVVTVDQGTTPWTTSDAADGSVAGGAAGTKSMLGGAVYNTTPPTLTNGQQASLQSDAAGNLDVNLKTAIPAGANAIGSVLANMQVAGAPVTVVNPVPVTITSASAGMPIQAYMTSAALAAGSTATLTYTVPATHTFSLERVWASASGKIKVVVQNGATTIFVGFNSTATPNVDITVTAPPSIAAAGTVNVLITNDDKAAMDVYATVEGNQIS